MPGGKLKSTWEELRAGNELYAASFDRADLTAPPRLGLAILTCMDARIVPHHFLGLEEGDAHVLRNAGGRVSGDALRSLIVSTSCLGVRELLIIQHTDCGMMGLDEEALRRRLGDETGVDASPIDFLSFDGLEESLRRDVQTVRSSPFIAADFVVHGLIYDVATGRLREVE